MDFGALVLVATAEALYLRALRVLRARGVAVPRSQLAFWHAGIALWVIGFVSPVERARRRAAVGPHGPAPADRRPGGAAADRRGPQPGARLPAAAPGARHAGALAAAALVRRAQAADGGRAGLRARPLRLALLRLLRGGGPQPVRSRAPAHELRGDRRARLVVGARAQAAAAARRAVEGAVPDRGTDGRDAARHGLRADPRADLHRRLRRGATAGTGSARSPTSRRREP